MKIETDLEPQRVENRRWMLVDDNTDLLMMLAAVVENLTSAAIECHNTPQSALAAYAAAPEKYELVITDFDMPGMTGVDLCQQMRAVTPAQRIFLTTGSGYFSEVAARAFGFCALLNKPYPLAALQNALASVGLVQQAACAA
jgi:CheY-like chemotaxis protein